MCSIMGYCGSGATFASFSKAFDKTVSRGPDDTRIIDTGKGLLMTSITITERHL